MYGIEERRWADHFAAFGGLCDRVAQTLEELFIAKVVQRFLEHALNLAVSNLFWGGLVWPQHLSTEPATLTELFDHKKKRNGLDESSPHVTPDTVFRVKRARS